MGYRLPSAVVKDPHVMGGVPVIRGTRVPAHLILALTRQGASETEILETYPYLSLEDVKVALQYAEEHPEEQH
jgi:uncharacterized protein (DUF433 family)